MTTPALRLRGVTKRFGDLVANHDVDLDVARGEVHVLLGENGAGKSTLMNVAFGHVRPDSGSIEIHGEAVDLRSPADAIERGMGMVHQHFTLVSTFTVAENVLLGASGRTRRFDRAELIREIDALGARVGVPVAAGARVADLPVDERQRVEILKALQHDAQILILDEPTSLLGARQITTLLGIIDRLRADGRGIVLVTHKLAEVVEIADRVTVLRQGRIVDTMQRGSFDSAALARAMTGQDLGRLLGNRAGAIGTGAALECRQLAVAAPSSGPALQPLDLVLREGEILGVAGVEGNGQRALVDGITGHCTSGTLQLGGADVTSCSIRQLRQRGVGIVPEDRRGAGLVPDMTTTENLFLVELLSAKRSRRPVSWSTLVERARTLLEEYGIRPADPHARVSTLSGGNQQKLVLARELSREPAFLLADNPSWGLDVGAVDFVHRQLLAARTRGTAIVLISHDLDELLALSDRLIVLYRGAVLHETERAEADLDRIAMAMAGST